MDPESMDTVDLLERRDRSQMHRGDPFEIIGLGERDNSFRQGLHAAARGAYEPALIDQDSMRDRQLAMYEGGARFSASTRRAQVGEAPTPAAAPPANDREGPGDDEPRSTAWIGIVLAACSSVVFFLLRGRLGT